MSDAFKNYKSMCIEFGMTPVARSRVTVNKKEEEDIFSKFDN